MHLADFLFHMEFFVEYLLKRSLYVLVYWHNEYLRLHSTCQRFQTFITEKNYFKSIFFYENCFVSQHNINRVEESTKGYYPIILWLMYVRTYNIKEDSLISSLRMRMVMATVRVLGFTKRWSMCKLITYLNNYLFNEIIKQINLKDYNVT